jgi:aspartyl aminopeptidase
MADDALRLIDFIDASPSPFHACANAATRLEAAGFTLLDETAPWTADEVAQGYVIRGGSLVAWRADRHAPATGLRIIGAHTDSPNLRIKPRPDLSNAGVRQVGVEVYGGALLNSWLDRDLGLSGRVAVRSAQGMDERLLVVDRPLLRVPQLAIHLHREIREEGLKLNPQQHLAPIWEVGELSEGAFLEFIAAELAVDPGAIDGWDLMTHDVQPGALVGRNQEFISIGRLDNLMSSFAGLEALLAAEPDDPHVQLLVLFDHEEIGSTSDRGAASAMLPAVIERITSARGGDRGDLHRALAGSICLSADNAHATHPNYVDKHDSQHTIALNGGPVLKTNANQRYASDAASSAAFLAACRTAEVPFQQYSHRNDLPCGSTIGPITASNLGISTVDVGAPQLAMHSARELAGTDDAEHYRKALTSFLRS